METNVFDAPRSPTKNVMRGGLLSAFEADLTAELERFEASTGASTRPTSEVFTPPMTPSLNFESDNEPDEGEAQREDNEGRQPRQMSHKRLPPRRGSRDVAKAAGGAATAAAAAAASTPGSGALRFKYRKLLDRFKSPKTGESGGAVGLTKSSPRTPSSLVSGAAKKSALRRISTRKKKFVRNKSNQVFLSSSKIDSLLQGLGLEDDSIREEYTEALLQQLDPDGLGGVSHMVLAEAILTEGRRAVEHRETENPASKLDLSKLVQLQMLFSEAAAMPEPTSTPASPRMRSRRSSGTSIVSGASFGSTHTPRGSSRLSARNNTEPEATEYELDPAKRRKSSVANFEAAEASQLRLENDELRETIRTKTALMTASQAEADEQVGQMERQLRMAQEEVRVLRGQQRQLQQERDDAVAAQQALAQAEEKRMLELSWRDSRIHVLAEENHEQARLIEQLRSDLEAAVAELQTSQHQVRVHEQTLSAGQLELQRLQEQCSSLAAAADRARQLQHENEQLHQRLQSVNETAEVVETHLGTLEPERVADILRAHVDAMRAKRETATQAVQTIAVPEAATTTMLPGQLDMHVRVYELQSALQQAEQIMIKMTEERGEMLAALESQASFYREEREVMTAELNTRKKQLALRQDMETKHLACITRLKEPLMELTMSLQILKQKNAQMADELRVAQAQIQSKTTALQHYSQLLTNHLAEIDGIKSLVASHIKAGHRPVSAQDTEGYLALDLRLSEQTKRTQRLELELAAAQAMHQEAAGRVAALQHALSKAEGHEGPSAVMRRLVAQCSRESVLAGNIQTESTRLQHLEANYEEIIAAMEERIASYKRALADRDRTLAEQADMIGQVLLLHSQSPSEEARSKLGSLIEALAQRVRRPPALGFLSRAGRLSRRSSSDAVCPNDEDVKDLAWEDSYDMAQPAQRHHASGVFSVNQAGSATSITPPLLTRRSSTRLMTKV